MRYDITPARLFPFTTFWEDDDLSMASNNQGGLSISEDDIKVYVSAAIPGVDPKDVEITFEKGNVWIKAESKQEEKDNKKKYYRRAAQSFSYRVTVPGELDQNKEPEATYKHGIMTVAFAKAPKSQPKKIKVKNNE